MYFQPMPIVVQPPLSAMSSYFSGTSTSTGSSSHTHSLSTDSDSWSRPSSIFPRQQPIYTASGEAPVIYQPSTKPFSPVPPLDTGPISTQIATSRTAKVVSPDFDFSVPHGAIPVSSHSPGAIALSPRGSLPHSTPMYRELGHPARLPVESLRRDYDFGKPPENAEYLIERKGRRTTDKYKGTVRHHSQRRPSNRDEFDGPHQFLDPPSPRLIAAQGRDLPHLPTNLDVSEQDRILASVNDRLSQCAFDFVAKYRFPIPLEPDKRQVRVPSDREWTEWVYLLRRLATKRRIPARVLYNGQIKQLVTVLENSLEMRHAAKHQSRPIKDDRNVLQLISAGIQVAKILKDASAMEYLDRLYLDTEKRIQERRNRRVKFVTP